MCPGHSARGISRWPNAQRVNQESGVRNPSRPSVPCQTLKTWTSENVKSSSYWCKVEVHLSCSLYGAHGFQRNFISPLMIKCIFVSTGYIAKGLFPHLSTAMATRVNTDADTDIPWTIPLILHTALPNGQPVEWHEKLLHVKKFKRALKSTSFSWVNERYWCKQWKAIKPLAFFCCSFCILTQPCPKQKKAVSLHFCANAETQSETLQRVLWSPLLLSKMFFFTKKINKIPSNV